MADIKKISDQTKQAMKEKSAQSMPDVPSSKGWTPKRFKDSITKPMFDNENSLLSEVNRVVEEINNTVPAHIDVVHKTGDETITGVKTFETEGQTPPVHLKSEMPYVVSDKAGKVGMRAYTEDNGKGQMAGQVAIGYDESYGGHFANIQARCGEDEVHTLRTSHLGPTYHIAKNGEETTHKLPFDENVVHNTGNEIINGEKTFTSRVAVRGNKADAVLKPEGMYIYDENGNKTAGVFNEGGEVKLHLQKGNNSTVVKHKTIQVTEQGYGAVDLNLPLSSGTLATEGFVGRKVMEIVGGAPTYFDTLEELASWIENDETGAAKMTADINVLKENKADKTELFDRQYSSLENAPEELNVVIRDKVSADTYSEAREIQIGNEKFKFGSGSKIVANQQTGGTLPLLSNITIDGQTYALPNYSVDKSGLKFIDKAVINDYGYYRFDKKLEKNKCYMFVCVDYSEMALSTNCILFTHSDSYFHNALIYSTSDLEDNAAISVLRLDIESNTIEVEYMIDNLGNDTNTGSIYNFDYIEIYELPLGESEKTMQHQQTILALMDRIGQLEKKLGLSTRASVVGDTLEVTNATFEGDTMTIGGLAFDGETLIIGG